MQVKSKILKILAITLWIIAGTGVIVLLVAAINVKTNKHCRGFRIDIRGAEDFMFLDKEELVKIITKHGSDNLEGKPLAAIDLHELETEIGANVWVRKAELFFDNNLLLHINVLEKEPVARIFSEDGSSFYLDSSGGRLPLSSRMSVKLPVFTGFPEINGEWSREDSILVGQIRNISRYIVEDPFWMAQVAQISCEPDGSFEIVPMLGNHKIILGDGKNYENKFRRLFLFYKEVLSRVGIDKYATINVAFNNQVVATKKPASAPTVAHKRSLVLASGVDANGLLTTN